MITYLITSEKMEGEVILNFNDLNQLSSINFEGSFNEKQYKYFLSHNLYNLEQLEAFIKLTPFCNFTKQVKEISFEDFWNKYDEKTVSSKKKSQIRWNNMNKSARIKAFMYIPKYINNLPPGTRKKYAETYLNSEIWEN